MTQFEDLTNEELKEEIKLLRTLVMFDPQRSSELEDAEAEAKERLKEN